MPRVSLHAAGWCKLDFEAATERRSEVVLSEAARLAVLDEVRLAALEAARLAVLEVAGLAALEAATG